MPQIDNLGQVLLHIVILFTAALIVVRLMGSRTVGQLSPFDFIIMVGIGDIIITVSLDRAQTLLMGIEGLVTLLILQQLLSYLSLKNSTLRKWFEGTPIVLIQDGKIIRENFSKTHFNYDDLRQELHKEGMDMTNLSDIKLARIESCGAFSVVKKPEMAPLTKNEFELYLNNIQTNPLSPLGQEWIKIEQYMTEVHYLVQYLKNQAVLKQTNNSNEEIVTKDLQ